MNRHDIQNAISDRMPKKIQMPDVDLSNVELPKAVENRLSRVEKAINAIDVPKAVEDRLSKVEKAINTIDVPKAVQDRMPGRKRTNPLLSVAALAAVLSMFAAAWWLITSPRASVKVRETAGRIKARVSGEESGLQRYDNDTDLGSLLPDPEQTRPSVENETWPDTFADLEETVRAGNGSGTPRTADV